MVWRRCTNKDGMFVVIASLCDLLFYYSDKYSIINSNLKKDYTKGTQNIAPLPTSNLVQTILSTLCMLGRIYLKLNEVEDLNSCTDIRCSYNSLFVTKFSLYLFEDIQLSYLNNLPDAYLDILISCHEVMAFNDQNFVDNSIILIRTWFLLIWTFKEYGVKDPANLYTPSPVWISITIE